MIQALQSDGSKNIPKRVLNVEEGTLEEKNLHDFVTSTTTRVFSILGITLLGCIAGPEMWHQYDGYVSAEGNACQHM